MEKQSFSYTGKLSVYHVFHENNNYSEPSKDSGHIKTWFTYSSQGNNTRKNVVLSVHKELSVLCCILFVS
ncbi:MAG TPA: hypothetical protein VJH04_02555, partial [archaeon]|nr:hypothetical protein [archaeon]